MQSARHKVGRASETSEEQGGDSASRDAVGWRQHRLHWLLRVPVRRGKRPKQKKPPLLRYEGRDLHRVDVLEDFTREYGLLYVRLFMKYIG